MGTPEHHRDVWLGVLLVLAVALTAAAGAAAAACGGEAASTPSAAAKPAPSASPGQPIANATVEPVPAVSYAEPPASNPSGGRPFGIGAVGWRFKPTIDVEVTELGFYDAEQDGLAASHRVGIFDADTDDLVARVVITPGSPLDGAFRWEELDAPAELKGDHSYLVASECVEGDALYDYPGRGQDWAPEIGYDRKFFAARGFVAPRGDNPWLCFWGPNFKFVAASSGGR